jgi:hypothetical protein
MCLEVLPRLKLLEDNFNTFFATENSRAQREQASATACHPNVCVGLAQQSIMLAHQSH